MHPNGVASRDYLKDTNALAYFSECVELRKKDLRKVDTRCQNSRTFCLFFDPCVKCDQFFLCVVKSGVY